MAKAKRRDKSRVVLRTGESQRADGTYHYCWTDANRKGVMCMPRLLTNFDTKKSK